MGILPCDNISPNLKEKLPNPLQQNPYKDPLMLLLNSSIAIFNIANKNFNSIDDFYQKFVLNLYPEFKIQDIFKTSNSDILPKTYGGH